MLSQADLARETGRERSHLSALLDREIKLMNRNPSFLMAALMPLILIPVFSLLPFLQDKEMSRLLVRLPRYAGSPLVPVIGVAAALFFNSMSNVAATAISREGRHFWISRSLPVAPQLQVKAKVLHSMIFTVLNLLLVLGAMAFLRVLTPLGGLFVLVTGGLACLATAYGGLVVDLLRPNLKWTDPQQAMKGNYNVVFSMLLIWGTLAAMGGMAALLYAHARPLMLPGLLLLFGLEAFLLGKAAMALAGRCYVEIED